MTQIDSIQELRQLQIDILNTVHQFCQERGITYFLSSGTLLGAVRHGGYIPWDDDIDLYMPRESYDRFIREFVG
ncbi:MAG: LicD family protein, partial [Prevotellamassilia sp.]|nr:LicD family protein [Prevotellamassilia sp.]